MPSSELIVSSVDATRGSAAARERRERAVLERQIVELVERQRRAHARRAARQPPRQRARPSSASSTQIRSRPRCVEYWRPRRRLPTLASTSTACRSATARPSASSAAQPHGAAPSCVTSPSSAVRARSAASRGRRPAAEPAAGSRRSRTRQPPTTMPSRFGLGSSTRRTRATSAHASRRTASSSRWKDDGGGLEPCGKSRPPRRE